MNSSFLQILNSTTAGGLVAGITTILIWLLNNGKKESKSQQDIKAALNVILCDRIKERCNVYISRGYIYLDEYEDLQRMNDVYHNSLHGNGFIKQAMHAVEELEVRGNYSNAI